MNKCPNCGKEVQGDDIKCSCGHELGSKRFDWKKEDTDRSKTLAFYYIGSGLAIVLFALLWQDLTTIARIALIPIGMFGFLSGSLTLLKFDFGGPGLHVRLIKFVWGIMTTLIFLLFLSSVGCAIDPALILISQHGLNRVWIGLIILAFFWILTKFTDIVSEAIIPRALVKTDMLMASGREEEAMKGYYYLLSTGMPSIESSHRQRLVVLVLDWLLAHKRTKDALDIEKQAIQGKIKVPEAIRQRLDPLRKTPRPVERAAPAPPAEAIGRDVSINQIGEMIKSGNVMALSSIFQRAGDWDTRENIVVALRTMVWEKWSFNHNDMAQALGDIIQLCTAETGGGDYRSNCVRTAQELLVKLGDAKS